MAFTPVTRQRHSKRRRSQTTLVSVGDGRYRYSRGLNSGGSNARRSARESPDSLGQTTPVGQANNRLPLRIPSTNLPEESISDDEDQRQVIMAVDIKDRGTVGCSYLIAQEEKLYILEDIVHSGVDTIEVWLVKFEIEPTVLLVSTRASQDPGKSLEGDQDSLMGLGTETQSEVLYHLDVRPSQEFNFQNARRRLGGLKACPNKSGTVKFLVPGDGFLHEQTAHPDQLDFTEEQGDLLCLGGVIGLENPVSIGCSGAILTYLQRKRASRYLTDNPSADQTIGIKTIEMLSMQKIMFINKDTLSSLRIIQSESHPNAFNQGPGKVSSGPKESLSIYGLFSHLARTPQGKNLLKQYFLRPSTNLDTICQRHDFIDMLLRPESDPVLQKLSQCLKRIKNLRPVMIHLRKGISTGSAKSRGFKGIVWSTFLEFAFHAIDIHQSLKGLDGGHTLSLFTKALLKLDLVGLHQVGRIIHETVSIILLVIGLKKLTLIQVDLSSSIEEYRTVVQIGIDEELDKLKETYKGMDHLLNQVAINIASTLPEDLNCEINVIYFPQLGFNIAIPVTESGHPMYDGGDGHWNQTFSTENRAYFKDYRMREMDEKIEKEIEIIYELAQKVLTYENMLVEASDICGEIDSVLALAQGARLNKLVRPEMTDENIIMIKGGRHMLHEATVASFVPNDTYIVGGSGLGNEEINQGISPFNGDSRKPSVLLLTGPNFSGKSVYLTQARKQFQSTFANDLQQVTFALNQATNRSLVLVDEFGKGTEPTDGAGLACGLFEYILSMKHECPKVLAATHFHEIFEEGFLEPRPELEFGHMEVKVDTTKQDLENQVTFQLGRSSSSFGTNCAAMSGIDPEIIYRARKIEELARQGVNIVAACARVTAAELAELEESETLARRFLEMDLSEASESHPEGYSENIRGRLGMLNRDSGNKYQRCSVVMDIEE
ncbi:MutS protein msh5 [Myotisia sp. PD_48]|nr:MutS protein msh5 [Myotisia sp. PD_48]